MRDFMKLFLPKMFSMIQSGGRSSAIKPLLCLVGFTLVGIFLSPESAQIVGLPLKGILVCVFAAISFVTLISYLVLIFKDPRLLQSEHYQLAMRRMDIAAQRLGAPPNFVDVRDVAQPRHESLVGIDASKRILVNDVKDSVEGIAAKEAI